MDVFAVILLLIIIGLIISNKTSSNTKLDQLEFRIRELQNLLYQKERQSGLTEKPKETTPEPVLVKPPSEIKRSFEPPKPPEPTPKEEVTQEPVIERHKQIITDPGSAIKRPISDRKPPIREQREPQPSFFERYPDLEKFIGENLINKIGIAILVLAIGFFVKYAIDNNWVGPIGRVGIGILCGAILVAFAHRMRNNYKAFSSVLVGGGIAIFYFSITLAYQEFHLFSQLASLVIMIVITLFAVSLALLYDRQELAVIALIGGFSSPFMLSNGTANYNGVFLYLLILNTGLLIIAYYKAWRVLNIAAFALSVIVLSTIIFTLPPKSYLTGFWYASFFYLLFFTINIINNIRDNKKFLSSDFSILLANTALYFAAGLYLLTAMGEQQFRGLFSAALGVINLGLSFILFRNRKADPNVLYLLIGITLTFISLTAPIQLHGNNITLFWASETVLLYWLYQKSGIKLMKLTSIVLWLATILSLATDLIAIYGYREAQLTILANKGFITTLFAAASSYLLYVLISKDDKPDIYGIPINKELYRLSAFVLLFISGILEINYQFLFYYPGSYLNVIYLMLYVPAFIYVLITVTNRFGGLKWQLGILLTAAAIVVYTSYTSDFFDALSNMLEHRQVSTVHFAAHWISTVFIGLLFYTFIGLCRKNLSEDAMKLPTWIVSAGIVLFLSLEVCLLSELLFYSKTTTIDRIQTVYIKTALPVLWGLLSFILMWLGMRNKQRLLRIISLTLFSVTLLKLFLFDINNIPAAGKIAAFFCLGVLLLIISFMYQKVKKIIVDDEAATKD